MVAPLQIKTERFVDWAEVEEQVEGAFAESKEENEVWHPLARGRGYEMILEPRQWRVA
jgi:hypothetical protein